MDDQPLVSVIVPCYNQARYMADAVASLIEQSHANWECILVDDGSTDNTSEVAKELVERDSRVRYIAQENRGLAGARNSGLDEAKGEYIQFLDADDLLFPEKFTLQLGDLSGNDRVSLSYCRPFFCLGDDTKTEISSTRPFPLLDARDPLHDLAFRWEKGLSIPCHTFLFDARLFTVNRVRFDESLENHEDWDCWMRIFDQRPEVFFVDRKLAVYRRHEVSMCRDDRWMRQGWIAALAKQRDLHRGDPSLFAILDARFTFLTYSEEEEEEVDLPPTPLVSVIVTSYNYENYIEECLRSIYHQTYRNVEIIVVDDGSTDHSRTVIDETLKDSPFPHKKIYKKNGGQGSALNAGFIQAGGEVVCFLDSDDSWRGDRIGRVVDFMHQFPGGGIYQHQMETGNGLKRNGLLSADVFGLWKTWGGGTFNICDDHDGVLFSPFLPTSGLTLRKEILDKIFPIPLTLVSCPDAFITRTACCYGPLYSIPATLGTWRDHGENAGYGEYGNSEDYWVPVILPALNQYYERHRIPFSLRKDHRTRSAHSAALALGEGGARRRNVSAKGTAPSPIKARPPAAPKVPYRRRIANFLRIFLTERRVQRMRRIFYSDSQTSRTPHFIVGTPLGRFIGSCLRAVLPERVVTRIRHAFLKKTDFM